jgi:hypothetical protein
MTHTAGLIGMMMTAVAIAGCESDSVTAGPTTASSTRTTHSTTTVEEPRSVDIATKPGADNQSSLPHGQPDRPGY